MTAALPSAPKPKARRQKRPDFAQLEIFLEVADARSFSAAARRTGRTQPAVSRAIGRLEEICGGDLFERRVGAPLVLSPMGEAVLPTARSLLHSIDQLLARATRTALSQHGVLKLGFYPGLASGPLRTAIADFPAICPGVQLRLVEGLPGELYRQLTERTIDLMIVGLMPNLASPDLAQERLWEERLVVALSEHHPLAAKASLDWREVATLPLMLRTSQGEYAGYHALLRQIGDRVFECEQHPVSRGALLEMVAIGLGATILFESGIIPCPGVTFKPIEDVNAVAAIEAIWPPADGNPLRHSFLKHIRKHAAREAIGAP